MLGMIYSFIPVLLVTGVAGPLVATLSRTNGLIDTKRFFIVTTAVITAPWLLAGPYGLLASALMLLSYGYPTAYLYLRFASDGLTGVPPQKQTIS